MIDEKKYPKLAEATNKVIDRRMRWLKESIEAECLADMLPEEIKVMDIDEIDCSSGLLSITIGNGQEALKTLKMIGVQGLKPRVSNWSKNQFFSSGKGMLPNGIEFTITVQGIDKPEGCEVIEKPTTIISRVLVCTGTGEEL